MIKYRIALPFFLLLLSSSLPFSQGVGEIAIPNWITLSTLAILISLSIVSLAYMAAIGLNIPDLKAWAGNELSQVIATALILISLAAVLQFMATASEELIGDEFNCSESDPISIANCYLDSLMGATQIAMRANLLDAFNNGKTSSERTGTSSVTIYTLYYAYYTGNNAGYSIYTDRFSSNFEALSGFYTFLSAQKSFLKTVAGTGGNLLSGSLGSILLFSGVILRSFFFSRRLGGLLLAIGIGLLFVWPLLYPLAWFTLKVSVFGDQMVLGPGDICPKECGYSPPKFTDSNGNGVQDRGENSCTEIQGEVLGACTQATVNLLDDANRNNRIDTWEANGNERLIGYSAQTDGNGNLQVTLTGRFTCPSICREIPYPITTPGCTKSALINELTGNLVQNVDVRELCSTCPSGCKVGSTDYGGAHPQRLRTTCFTADSSGIWSGSKNPVPEDVALLAGESNCKATNQLSQADSACYNWCSAVYPTVYGDDYNSPECGTQGGATRCPTATCPDFCRVYYYDPAHPEATQDWEAPSPAFFEGLPEASQWRACNDCDEASCPFGRNADGDRDENVPICRIGLPNPRKLDCQESCAECPAECRIKDVGGSSDYGGYYAANCNTNACTQCRTYCGITVPPAGGDANCANFEITQGEIANPPADGTCTACPKRCRISDSSSLPDTLCQAAVCSSPDYCAPECKSPSSATTPPSVCDACLKCDDDCTTSPPVRTNCAELCTLPSGGSQDFTPAGFISSGGADTLMPDQKNIGMLAIPALILPLFNIVITVAFIRILSQVLGGDIELPGISRLI